LKLSLQEPTICHSHSSSYDCQTGVVITMFLWKLHPFDLWKTYIVHTPVVKHVLLQFEDIEERHLSSVHLLQFIGIACEIYAQTQRITMVTEKSPARLGSLKIPSPPSVHQNMNFRGPVLRHNYVWCILCIFLHILGVPPVPD
jgi:hypothetical protein